MFCVAGAVPASAGRGAGWHLQHHRNKQECQFCKHYRLAKPPKNTCKTCNAFFCVIHIMLLAGLPRYYLIAYKMQFWLFFAKVFCFFFAYFYNALAKRGAFFCAVFPRVVCCLRLPSASGGRFALAGGFFGGFSFLKTFSVLRFPWRRGGGR